MRFAGWVLNCLLTFGGLVFHTALFTFDNTPACAESLPWAAAMAERVGARLCLMENDGTAEAIAAQAERIRADLILLPNPRRLFSRWRPASAEAVLACSPCAVWTHAPGFYAEDPVRQVVCAVSHSSTAGATLAEAAQLAELLRAELTVAYAVPELTEGVLGSMVEAPPFLSEAEARRHLGLLCATLRVRAEVWVDTGTVPGVISRIAGRREAGLLVVGRSQSGVTAITHSLIRRAICPVLVMPAVRQAVTRPSGHYVDDQRVVIAKP